MHNWIRKRIITKLLIIIVSGSFFISFCLQLKKNNDMHCSYLQEKNEAIFIDTIRKPLSPEYAVFNFLAITPVSSSVLILENYFTLLS